MEANELISHIDAAGFEEKVLKSDRTVLVDFWAPWCAPCLAIGPMLEDLAREYEGRLAIVKVNVDENPDTAMRYGIMSIPALLIIREGRVLETRIGSMPRVQLKAFIDKNLP